MIVYKHGFRHRARMKYFPRKVVVAMNDRDLKWPLDWKHPTRLDMEINRLFVYWRTTRADVGGGAHE